MAPKPTEFTEQEIAIIRRMIASEIKKEEEENRVQEARDAHFAKLAAEQEETERLQKAAKEMCSDPWFMHNSVFDAHGCACRGCAETKRKLVMEGKVPLFRTNHIG